MGITQKYSIFSRLFTADQTKVIDQHLMEIYQIDLPCLNEIKTFQPTEYRKMKAEELGFWERAAF